MNENREHREHTIRRKTHNQTIKQKRQAKRQPTPRKNNLKIEKERTKVLQKIKKSHQHR